MNQILCCDRQPERLRWSHLVHSGLPAVYHKKMAAVSCLGLSTCKRTSTSFPGLFPWRWAGRLAPPTFKGKALGARLKGLGIYQAILEEQTWSINHISCIFLHISIESAIFKTDLDGRPSPGRPPILRYKKAENGRQHGHKAFLLQLNARQKMRDLIYGWKQNFKTPHPLLPHIFMTCWWYPSRVTINSRAKIVKMIIRSKTVLNYMFYELYDAFPFTSVPSTCI